MGKYLKIKDSNFNDYSLGNTQILEPIPDGDVYLSYIKTGATNLVYLDVPIIRTDTLRIKFYSPTGKITRVVTGTNGYGVSEINGGNTGIYINFLNLHDTSIPTNLPGYRNMIVEVVSSENQCIVNDNIIPIPRVSNNGIIHTMYGDGTQNNQVNRIYYVKVDNKFNIIPVLSNGIPKFYDTYSKTYYNIVGSDGVWYATLLNPNTEIEYITS